MPKPLDIAAPIRTRRTGILIAFTLALFTFSTAFAADPPATRPSVPFTPGLHDLVLPMDLNGTSRPIAYTVFLPKDYDPAKRYPMLVYLIGAGDRGADHRGIYNNGPTLALRADKSLADWAPFIVVCPQCPGDQRWEMPGMPKLAMDFIEFARRAWLVEDDRIYLTGLSMGGRGVWNVMLEPRAKGMFAVVNPFCAIEVAADRMPDAVRGATVCIICGGADNGFTAGSRKMYQVLKDNKIDVLYAEIPGVGHGVWQAFYSNRRFYEFLLLHRRGTRPPSTRPSSEQLVAISYTPPNSADAQLADPLQKFLPWWFVSNCGKDNTPGLKDELLGRKIVFVTTPLARTVPCRLLFTTTIPKGKTTTLNLTVAAPPQGSWQLTVVAEGAELLKRTITGQVASKATTKPAAPINPWINCTVDLTPLAGQEIHLELLNGALDSPHPEAYWGKVELLSK